MQIQGRAMGWILAIIAIIFSSFMAAPAMAVDEPAFKVVGRSGDVELREYVAYMVAETKVNADFSGAGNLAFGPLFKYISGNNRAQEKIEMTAPVSQAAATGKGEKIEMTAPVTQIPAAKGANAYLIAFVMPARYTPQTLPQPLDARITLREIAARKVAVLRFSGTWSEARYAEHVEMLQAEIAKAGWRITGPVEFARYDPPFMPWFLRRNEVMIEVEARTSAPG
ncbi:MAG: heme-binding protein [Usitatibacteraceae bacterium]